MSDVFHEIEADLRRDWWVKLWRSYGAYVLGAAIGVVIVTGGLVWWKDHRRAQHEATTAGFVRAAETAADASAREAADAFKAVAENSGGGVAALARLRQAQAMVEGGDAAGAVKIYDEVAADNSIDSLYRSLAGLFAATVRFDTAPESELTLRLEKLAADDGPWRHSARELQALLAYRGGDIEKARDLLSKLAADTSAPPPLRGRAAEMVDIIRK